MAALGRHPAAAGDAPYHFSEEEARLVGRYRYYFSETGKARQVASVLAAIGLTALLLVPWLAYKARLRARGADRLQRGGGCVPDERLIPMVDTSPVWQKIRAGNE